MSDEEAAQALSRRERERLTHRAEILDAAEQVFARNGYHGATVEEIAQEAEFAVGTLYNFFRGKDDLYQEVVAKLAEEFMGMFRQRVLDQPDPVEAIGALIEVRMTIFEKHRGFARVFFESMLGSHIDLAQALPERCASMYEEAIAALTAIFQRGVQNGSFISVDPLYLTLCLHGVMNAFTAYWARQEPVEPLEARVGKLKEVFLNRIVCRES